MSNSKLKFSKDKKGEIRWQLSARVAGKTKIVDASTEGFKRVGGAVKNIKASAKRLNDVVNQWYREKQGTELQRALKEFNESRRVH